MSPVAWISVSTLVFLIVAANSVGFQTSRKAQSPRRYPLWWAGTYNVIAVVILLCGALVNIAGYGDVASVSYIGFAVLLFGAALRVWSVIHLGPNFSYEILSEPKESLVCSGPYRVLRHPIYIAQLVMCVGLWILTGSVWLLPILIGLVPLIAILGRYEDRQLSSQFGSQFEAYRRRTWSLG